MNEPALKRLPLIEIYRNIYPWASLNQFVDQIKSTIAYKSPDNSLIALNKPFGVGTYIVQDRNTTKQNQDKILYQLHGYPRYCLSDALDPLTQEFNSPAPYKIIKGIDRYMSGLVLITNDLNKHGRNFHRSIASARINKTPPYGMRAITSGYPTIKSNKIYERVGIEQTEIDEFGDYKEPIVVPNPGSSFEGKHKYKRVFQAELEVKKVNREYSASLVELYVSKLAWDFPRCYISSKTSFILGDVRFSKRIREILGKPIQVSAFKSSHRYDDGYEPLNSKLGNLLGVSKNASIPLMLDLHTFRLKGFEHKKDLLIKSPYMPIHFALTAQRLNLLDDSSLSDGADNNDNKSDTVA